MAASGRHFFQNEFEKKPVRVSMYDLVVIGSGIGGLTTAALCAKQGMKVLVLEANWLPGGCCSSYPRKDFIFDAGATTLMGFDEGQPLYLLSKVLNLKLEKWKIETPMEIHIDGKQIVKGNNNLSEQSEGAVFGDVEKQKKFWKLAEKVSAFAWKASSKNLNFPPANLWDWITLPVNNSIADLPFLKYAFYSVKDIIAKVGLSQNLPFCRFIDEQLMITAQNTAENTSFLFGAPALCYTSSFNYYLPGGMIKMTEAIIDVLKNSGGEILLRKKVTTIVQSKECFSVTTEGGNSYKAKKVVSNIPLWNLPAITEGNLKKYTMALSDKFNHYWGAYTLGIAVKDSFPIDQVLHTQIILPEGVKIPFCNSTSFFVSLSHPSDRQRTPIGARTIAISTHAEHPKEWFTISKEEAEKRKLEINEFILSILEKEFTGFDRNDILFFTASNPHAWQKWTFRQHGTVGGIPQDIKKSFFSWPGAHTPVKGFYMCGDTVYPGQGIPGVALGGIIAANRILGKNPLKF